MARRGYSPSQRGAFPKSGEPSRAKVVALPSRRSQPRSRREEALILIASKSERPRSTDSVTRRVIVPAILEFVTPSTAARAGGQR
jgi:hypothetical protein